MNNPYTEFAKEFKKRDNVSVQGITVGTVTSPPPNLVIVVNGFILDKEQLVVADYLLSGYKREMITRGSGNITAKTPVPPPIYYDQHTVIESIDFAGDITLTDTLKAGDKVIVMPSTNNEIYYVLSKVGEL